MNIIDVIKKRKLVFLASAAVVLVLLIAGIANSMEAFASEVYWDLKIGDEKVAVFNTEEEANKVISNVKNAYVEKGSKVLSITVDPEMTVAETTYKMSEKPDLADVKEVTDYILTGTEEKREYKVKENETLWDISLKNGFSVEELIKMNPEKDPEMIFPGDVLNFYEMQPLVDVTTEQIIKVKKDIQFRTVEKKTSELYEDEAAYKQQGKIGLKRVTEKVKMKNSKIVSTKVKSSKVLRKPVKEIILVGTAEREVPEEEVTPQENETASEPVTSSEPTAPSQPAAPSKPASSYDGGSTQSGNGSEVASFAMQFVGSPYVYGGSSLTGGADCSGFVMAVYNHFGISLPHGAIPMRGYGRSVSMSAARPGDIICNPGHVGIYIGGGQMVNAVNEHLGVAVTSVSYTGPVLDVRRIVE